MPTDSDTVKEAMKAAKRRILDCLRKEGIVGDKDTGLILIHLNDGGITKVAKNMDVLK